MKAACLLLALFALPAIAAAQEDPRVAILDVLLRTHVYSDDPRIAAQLSERIEQPDPDRDYYVAIVERSGHDADSQVTFGRTLFVDLEAHARQSKLPLHDEKIVLIVIGRENRSINVLPGAALQAKWSLTPAVVERDLVTPHFLPHARSGDLVVGAANLIAAMEAFIEAKEAPAQPARVADPVQEALPSIKRQPEPAVRQEATLQDATVARDLPAVTAASGSIWLILGIIAAGAGLVAVRWLWHGRVKSRAASELAAYKEQVVQVSDRLDALKERHKMLTFEDQDYKAPMTGETLAIYSGVADCLERFRVRWLKLMDAWQQADDLRQTERPFGTARSQQARKLINEAGAPSELAAIEQECAQPLDRLEQAHETVAEQSKNLEQARQRLEKLYESIRAAGLPISPYQAGDQSSARLEEQAKAASLADPLAAQQHLTAGMELLQAASVRMEKILQLARDEAQRQTRMQEIAALASRRRAEGMKLSEPEGNPDPLLASAESQLDGTKAALQQGDAEVAGAALKQATAFLDQAESAIDRQVKARDWSGKELVVQRQHGTRLAEALRQAQAEEAELEREFAPDSWRAVADHDSTARSLAATHRQLVEQAATLSAPHDQRYFAAQSNLERAGESLVKGEQLLQALTGRLAELRELRSRSQAQLSQLQGRLEQVGQMLRSHTTDRPRSHARFHAARQSLEAALQDSRTSRADWQRIGHALAETQNDLQNAERLAQEDQQLAQQAASEIAEADQAIRAAQSFGSMGMAADLSGAAAQLQTARSRMMNQAYEEAISIANGAERAARGAQQEAADRARRLQEQQESQRRAQQMAAAAQFAAQRAQVSHPVPSHSVSPPISGGGASTPTARPGNASNTNW